MGWEVADEVRPGRGVDDRDFLTELFASKKDPRRRRGRLGDSQASTLHKMLADSPRIYPGVVELIEKVKTQRSHQACDRDINFAQNVTVVLRATETPRHVLGDRHQGRRQMYRAGLLGVSMRRGLDGHSRLRRRGDRGLTQRPDRGRGAGGSM